MQLLRASSSVALNLAEGSGKPDPKEQRRFYGIAFGSLRECQGIISIENLRDPTLISQSDRLGAMLYKLTRTPLQLTRTAKKRKSGNGTETATETATETDGRKGLRWDEK